MPEYLTTIEVAELVRAAPETVRYWRHVGYGPPSFRVGRRVLYDASRVRDWLATREAADRSAAKVEHVAGSIARAGTAPTSGGDSQEAA